MSNPIKYLFTLERFIDPLYTGNAESIQDTLPALMNSIKMIHTIARYYNTPERMTNLFAKIIRKPDYFDVNRSFRTWVFSVACNMCKNEYKRMSVRKHVSNEFEPTKSIQSDSDTLKKVHESSFSESFHRALNKLDDKHKSVFSLRHFEGFSMKEIAETLNINEGTVKSRLFYATKTLAGTLKEFNPIYNQ